LKSQVSFLKAVGSASVRNPAKSRTADDSSICERTL
jgi:hypothetical protein